MANLHFFSVHKPFLSTLRYNIQDFREQKAASVTSHLNDSCYRSYCGLDTSPSTFFFILRHGNQHKYKSRMRVFLGQSLATCPGNILDLNGLRENDTFASQIISYFFIHVPLSLFFSVLLPFFCLLHLPHVMGGDNFSCGKTNYVAHRWSCTVHIHETIASHKKNPHSHLMSI